MIIKFTDLQSLVPQVRATIENWQAAGIDVQPGDWIFVQFGDPIRLVKSSEYQNSAELNQLVKEAVGADLLKTIFQAFKDNGSISNADKHSILVTISYILLGISMGKIQQARELAAVIPVAAPFTNGVKNQLLQYIDDALATL